MKRNTLLALPALAMAAALCACTPSPAAQGVPPPAEPLRVEVRQPKELDMGDVTILYGGYWSNGVDEKRSEEILELVCRSILRQRNIAMKLGFVRSEHALVEEAQQRIAAGNPPQIYVRTFNDRPEKLFPPMLRLNDAIDTFGPNLSKIPEWGWARCKIGDDIVAIPSVGLALERTTAANKHAMDAHGWAVPTTAEQFEELLRSAKDAGLRPIDNGAIPPEWFGYDQSAWAWQDGDGSLRSIYESPQYTDYIDTLHRWTAAGFLGQQPEVDDGKWLFRSVFLRDIATDADLEPLPVLSLGSQPAFARSPWSELYTFESYDKPEALVTLLDWAYENEDNHSLVARGETGKDWEPLGNKGYRLLNDDPYFIKWELQEFLAMDGFLDNPVRCCTNDSGLRRAIELQEQGEGGNAFLSPPTVTERYALPNTALLAAWQFRPSDEFLNAEGEYIAGLIDHDAFDKQREKAIEACKPRLELLSQMLEKSYDPLKDMYKPFAGDGN